MLIPLGRRGVMNSAVLNPHFRHSHNVGAQLFKFLSSALTTDWLKIFSLLEKQLFKFHSSIFFFCVIWFSSSCRLQNLVIISQNNAIKAEISHLLQYIVMKSYLKYGALVYDPTANRQWESVNSPAEERLLLALVYIYWRACMRKWDESSAHAAHARFPFTKLKSSHQLYPVKKP